jgi:hypothetical protein
VTRIDVDEGSRKAHSKMSMLSFGREDHTGELYAIDGLSTR